MGQGSMPGSLGGQRAGPDRRSAEAPGGLQQRRKPAIEIGLEGVDIFQVDGAAAASARWALRSSAVGYGRAVEHGWVGDPSLLVWFRVVARWTVCCLKNSCLHIQGVMPQLQLDREHTTGRRVGPAG
jgi:hypothetical protein